MNKLTYKDLIENEIYYSDSPTNYIFQSYNQGGWKHYIYENHSYQSTKNTSFKWSGNLRIATKQEKVWLLVCIKANKFVPMPTGYNIEIPKLSIE